MKTYFKIPIWTTLYRINFLKKFRFNIQSYFFNIRYGTMALKPHENETAQKARFNISRTLDIAHQMINETGVSTLVRIDNQSTDIVVNIFSLYQCEKGGDEVLFFIDRAIGLYQDHIVPSILNTINPLFWIGRTLEYIISLPFKLIGKVGFNQTKAEESFVGRLLKILFYAGSLAVIILTLYQGREDGQKIIEWIKSFFLNNKI
ncbi:hypothetical protein ACFL49_00650 [Candidatus Omnitrophota bacterium]